MRIAHIKKFLVIFSLLLALIGSLSVSYFRILDSYELETLDARFLLRPKSSFTDKVILVEIGEDTIKKLGRFPFDRSYHAILVKALSEFGAKAVLFDLFFSEEQNDDNEFSSAIKDAGNVYLPFVFDLDNNKNAVGVPVAKGYLARNLETFTTFAKNTGHINILPDIDGKFRRIPPYIKYNNALYPYLSLQLAADYLGLKDKDINIIPGKSLLLGNDLKIPLDENSNIIINYSGRWADVYKHCSYVDILQSYFAVISGGKPILDAKFFKDNICIVGLTATGTVDIHPNPFESLYPGMGIHAEIFNSIIKRSFITRLSKKMNLLLLMLAALLVCLVTKSTKPVKGAAFLILMIIIFLSSGIAVFNIYGLWIDIICPVSIMALAYILTTLYKYIMEWKRRLLFENELGIAKKIQESFLPKKIPDITGFGVSARMFTARQVGGDLYDFLDFSNGRLGVMIGDVSGKGVPASLFMAMVSSSFKFFATPDSSPGDVLRKLNSRIVKESSSNLFVTVFYSIFDTVNNKVIYANGGHLPVLRLSSSGETEFLDVEEGAPLGLMNGDYSQKEIGFNKGDVFIFYTDGVTEAMNERREMYGKERLVAAAKKNRDKNALGILQAIEKDVRAFEPVASQHDDITLIVLTTGER